MRKNIISENRLQELVNESIYEVLNESEFDEGFGHWLGQTYQGIKNKWNNLKKDFEAGRDKARYDNKDYNGYSHFGDEENELRKMNHGGYGNYRYNLEKSRNQQAKGEDDSTTEPTNISNNNFQPHPSLSTQDNTNDDSADTTTQSKRTEVQSRFNSGNYPSNPQSWMRKKGPSPASNRKIEALDVIKKAGMVPQGGNWNDPRTGWDNVNGGGLTDKQKEILKYYKKFLYEEKLNELNKILNEIKTVRIKNK